MNMLAESEKNDALEAEDKYKTAVESANDYIENFDILETITNVGNDEVFTPRKTCDMILDSLPEEVWHNPNYKWLNPATKNGIFEREIAIRLDDGLKDIIPDTEQRRKHILQNMIYSIGQTRFTANVARRTVYYCSQANRKCDGIKADDGHYVNGYAIGNGSWFDDEEGNIKTPNINHTFVDDKGETMPSSCSDDKEKKKYRCKYCGINGASAYNDANQRETYAYEFIHFNGDELLKHLQDRFFGGNRKMKFDIIIGNPPYQLSDGGAQASARPIYQLFVQQAISLKPKYISMIMPSKWMIGGKGLDSFRAEFISDKRIKVLHDFMNPKACFPNNEIQGGVCFFLWDEKYSGECSITTHLIDCEKKSQRFLQEEGCDIYIREEILISIKNKASSLKEKTFDSMVSASKPYGFRAETMLSAKKFGLPEFSKTCIEGGYEILGLGEGKRRIWKYLPNNYPLPKTSACLNTYKIFISEADGAAGQIGNPVPARIIGKPLVVKPKTLCTETFLEIGPFSTENEADNAAKYIRTKFFRTLVGIQKQTQHTTAKVYRFVPLQDFTENSDIKWNEPIDSIDKQLFIKYKLSKEEIDFIEKNIQEME